MPSRRRLARIAVIQTLFELDFPAPVSKSPPERVLQRNIAERDDGTVDSPFAQSLLAGIVAHLEDILRAVQEHAPQWPLERMDRITRAVLTVGAYELLFGNDVPPAVAMDEAIDIAKEFGGEESGKFVNGVLNAIAHC